MEGSFEMNTVSGVCSPPRFALALPKQAIQEYQIPAQIFPNKERTISTTLNVTWAQTLGREGKVLRFRSVFLIFCLSGLKLILSWSIHLSIFIMWPGCMVVFFFCAFYHHMQNIQISYRSPKCSVLQSLHFGLDVSVKYVNIFLHL